MNKSYSYDDQNLFGWKCRLVQIEDTMRFLGQQKIDAEEKVKEFEDAINAVSEKNCEKCGKNNINVEGDTICYDRNKLV